MGGVTSEIGKREAHKLATRRAIQDAADELFSAHGYAQTTVRDIADAAGVTERTFFRYFTGKESLLVKDIEAWLPVLGDEIRRRPADEPPLDAVEHAFYALWQRVLDGDRLNLTWLFHDGPPGPKLEKSAPGLLLRFETTVADALNERPGADDDFANQVLARCAVAALRSAGIRNWQLGTQKPGPDQAELIAEAFEVLRRAR
jgi:AcrR family transcriptional regulator